MKKNLILLALSFTCLTQSVIAQQKNDLSDKEMAEWAGRYMEYAVKFDHFSGVVLIAHNGTPVFSKAYGMANYEWQAPNTLDTKFRIGSISKTFTAAAIMKLYQQGKIDIDSSICRYLDDCPSHWKNITVRHLLSHTSGLVNFTALPEADANFLLLPHTHKEMVDLFREKTLETEPGKEFNYNNSGYYLLGLMIEKISGKSYEQYLNENIFIPLQMKNTGTDQGEKVISNRALGYNQVNDSLFVNTYDINMDNSFAIGNLYSTAQDLLLWDQAFYSNRLFDQPLVNMIFTRSRNSYYGLGWVVDSTGNCSRVYHDGGITDFSSSMQRITSKNITVIAISNKGGDAGIIVAYDIVGKICSYPATIRGIQDELTKKTSTESLLLIKEAQKNFERFRIDEALIEQVAIDLKKQDNHAQALEVYKLNTLLYPTSENVFLKLGEAYLAMGDKKKAKENFKKCLKINPANAKAVSYMKH